MALELYHADYSTCSQKVRIVLAEKGLDFRSRVLSFRKEEQLDPSYLALNPNGVVPTLIDDGEVIHDSSCIIEYLEEKFPNPALSPPSTLGRARMRKWLRYMEEVPTVAIRMPSFENVFLPTLRLVGTAKSFEKSSRRRTLRKGFYNSMNSGRGFDRDVYLNSIRQLRDTVDRMEKALAQGPWLLGESFGLADAALAPLIDRAEDMNMHFLWRDRPRLSDWLSRVQARPSFKQAFYKKSRLSERLEFKLAMRKARKRNASLSMSDFEDEVTRCS